MNLLKTKFKEKIIFLYKNYLLLLLVLSLDLIRKIALFQQTPHSVRSVDPVYHLFLVKQILSGNFERFLEAGYPPLFHFILAGIQLFIGNYLLLSQIFIVLISFSIILLMFLIARQVFSPIVTGLVSFITVIAYPFIFRSSLLLPENLALVFVLLWLYLAISLKHRWHKYLYQAITLVAVFFTNVLTSTQLISISFFLAIYFLWHKEFQKAFGYISATIGALLFVPILLLFNVDLFWLRYALLGAIFLIVFYSIFYLLANILKLIKVNIIFKLTIVLVLSSGIIFVFNNLSEIIRNISSRFHLTMFWNITNMDTIVVSLLQQRFGLNSSYVLSIHPLLWVAGIIGLLLWLFNKKNHHWVPVTFLALTVLSLSIVIFGGFLGINPDIDTDRMMLILMVPIVFGFGAFVDKMRKFPLLVMSIIIIIILASFPYVITIQYHEAPATYPDIIEAVKFIETQSVSSKYAIDSTSATSFEIFYQKSSLIPIAFSIDEWQKLTASTQLKRLREEGIDFIVETTRFPISKQLNIMMKKVLKLEHYVVWEVLKSNSK